VKGIEASSANPQSSENHSLSCDGENGYTQICAQIEKPLDSDLAAVVSAWPKLAAPLKNAILALVASITKEVGQ